MKRRKEADPGVIIFKQQIGVQTSLFEGDEHPIFTEIFVREDKKKLRRKNNENEH